MLGLGRTVFLLRLLARWHEPKMRKRKRREEAARQKTMKTSMRVSSLMSDGLDHRFILWKLEQKAESRYQHIGDVMPNWILAWYVSMNVW